MTESFLTATNVAQLLQLNVETVYALTAKQGLPAVKVCRLWRFEESKIRAWVEAQLVACEDGGAE